MAVGKGSMARASKAAGRGRKKAADTTAAADAPVKQETAEPEVLAEQETAGAEAPAEQKTAAPEADRQENAPKKRGRKAKTAEKPAEQTPAPKTRRRKVKAEQPAVEVNADAADKAAEKQSNIIAIGAEMPVYYY